MIDTHTHIYGNKFLDDLDEVVERSVSSSVTKVILQNEDSSTLETIHALTQKYPDFCYAMYGLHPTVVRENWQDELEKIYAFIDSHKENFLGIGEIGLDLYWEKDKADLQAEAFTNQLDYAIAHDLPVSIHVRDAFELFYKCIERNNYSALRGSLHCFAGTIEDAQKVQAMLPNLGFGFNGTCTYKNSHLPEIIKYLPLEKILLETDAPYLAPVPYRGKRNEPSFIPLVAELIAEIKGLPLKEIDLATTLNSKRIFSL